MAGLSCWRSDAAAKRYFLLLLHVKHLLLYFASLKQHAHGKSSLGYCNSMGEVFVYQCFLVDLKFVSVFLYLSLSFLKLQNISVMTDE